MLIRKLMVVGITALLTPLVLLSAAYAQETGVQEASPQKTDAQEVGNNVKSDRSFVVTDDDGTEHRFDKPVTKIISLMPHATELLFEVGAGSQIIGAVKYSNYPEAAKAIPRVGSYGAINIEAVIALQPELVVAWPEANRSRELDRLRALGVSIFVSNPSDYDSISASLINLGKITGNDKKAKNVQETFSKKLDSLRQEFSQKEKVSVFYQVWDSPLITQNGNTFISRAISLCGGVNIFSELPMTNPQVSVESILVQDPQVIIASGMGESRPEWLNDWRQYKTLQAVKNNHLYHVAPDLLQRPTSRFLLGTEQLCEAVQKARQ